MNEIKPFAFVLMPFETQYRDIYKYGIQDTARGLNIIAERVDEQHFSETILERIYRQIENADFIIAEMTGRNPNVFYEVGYAHAKGKMCILITQDPSQIPFDLKHHPHIIYDGSVDDLKKRLGPKLEWLKNEAEKRKTETISLTVKVRNSDLTKTEYSHQGSFDLLIGFKNPSERKSPVIEAIHITTSKLWTLKITNDDCPHEISGDAKNLKRHLLPAPITRLAPNGFTELKAKFSRTFWTKWSGDEKQEDYISKGNLEIEVVTSEGNFFHEFPIEVKLDEIPF